MKGMRGSRMFSRLAAPDWRSKMIHMYRGRVPAAVEPFPRALRVKVLWRGASCCVHDTSA